MPNSIEYIESEYGLIPKVNHRQLASRKNPVAEAELWSDRVQVVRETILVLGLGAGFHIKALAVKYPDKNIYVYENEEDIKSKFGDSFNVSGDKKALIQSLYNASEGQFQILTHPASYAVHKLDYDLFLKEVTGRSKNLRGDVLEAMGIDVNLENLPDLQLDRDVFSHLTPSLTSSNREFYYINKIVSEILK